MSGAMDHLHAYSDVNDCDIGKEILRKFGIKKINIKKNTPTK